MDSADVVIIGGGVTGLSSGFWLTRAGLDVVVVEKGIVGWEASGRNGGLVSQKGDTPAEVGLARRPAGSGRRWTRSWGTPPSGSARAACAS
jgi:glycine/D-amino acid oxidase-like deaminating enzyme